MTDEPVPEIVQCGEPIHTASWEPQPVLREAQRLTSLDVSGSESSLRSHFPLEISRLSCADPAWMHVALFLPSSGADPNCAASGSAEDHAVSLRLVTFR